MPPSPISEIPKCIHRVRINAPENCPEIFDRTWSQWKTLHPDWTFTTWTEHGEDRDKKDPRDLMSNGPLRDLYDSLDRWVLKADLFRVMCLSRLGGVYVDCDVMPLSAIDDDLKGELTLAREIPKKPGITSNAMFAAAAGEPFMTTLLGEMVKNLRAALEKMPEDKINPIYVTGPGMWSQRADIDLPTSIYTDQWQMGRAPTDNQLQEINNARNRGVTAIHLLTSSWVSGSKWRNV